MNFRYVIFVLLLLSTPLHGVLMAQWVRTNGVFGGYISSLVGTETKLFAGTASDGVFMSADSGATWTAVPVSDTVGEVAVLAAGSRATSLPGTSDTVLLAGINQSISGQGGGIYRSTDDGATWNLVSTSLGSVQVRAITFSDTIPFVATAQGLYFSSDGGTTWGEARRNDQSFELVYTLAATDSNIFAGGSGGTLYHSTNKGLTWTDISVSLTHRDIRVLGLATDSAGSISLFAGTRDGLFRSTDIGTTWSEVDSGLTNRINQAFLVDQCAGTGTTLFVGTNGGGVFRSTDNGTSWMSVSTGLTDRDVRTLACTGSSLVAGTWGSGIFRSTDGGTTWASSNAGLPPRPLYAFAANGTDVFAGTSGSGIYHTADRGTYWVQANEGLTRLDVYSLAFLPVGEGESHLFAGTNGGLFHSSDKGIHWLSADSTFKNATVSAFSALDSVLFAQTSDGIFRSVDRGTTWTLADTGISGTGTGGFAVVDSIILVGADGVFRSTNLGDSWALADSGFPYTPAIRAFTVCNGAVFAAMTTGALFRSRDRGMTWEALDTTWTNAYALSFAVSGNNIFTGTMNNGVFLSTDGGDHWSMVSTGLPGGKASPLVASDLDLYAATDLGVWRRPLAEMIMPVYATPEAVPISFALRQNYPNPFNPLTRIEYNVGRVEGRGTRDGWRVARGQGQVASVRLAIYDLLGREVAVLVNGKQTPGSYEVSFNGSELSSGVYIYRLTADSFVQSKKMLLMK